MKKKTSKLGQSSRKIWRWVIHEENIGFHVKKTNPHFTILYYGMEHSNILFCGISCKKCQRGDTYRLLCSNIVDFIMCRYCTSQFSFFRYRCGFKWKRDIKPVKSQCCTTQNGNQTKTNSWRTTKKQAGNYTQMQLLT